MNDQVEQIKTVTKKDYVLKKLKEVILSVWPSSINKVDDSVKCYYKYKPELSVC